MSQPYTMNHIWVGAAHVPLAPSVAGNAERRGTARVPKDTKVEILAVYCSQCRRPYDAVSDKPCVAAVNRDHLVGGPTGERRKRKDGPTQVAAGM